jgi:hypothetical protein
LSRPKPTRNAAPAAPALTYVAAIAILFWARASQAQSPPIQWPCSFNVPTVSGTIPNDATLSDQPTMNCFAWQEFIALNWAAAPGKRGVPDPNATPAGFGAPNATAPTVWETYKDKSEVFLPLGAKPKPWNDPPPAPPCASGDAAVRALLNKPGTQVLSFLSAFGDFILDETKQASGQWLADQKSNLIYYEIKLNEDEFDTIVGSEFYNGDVQNQTAANGVNPTGGGQYQIKLPAGCNSGSCPGNGQPQVGAIEMKAAWRILTDPAQYTRYLTNKAVLITSGACTQATVGLVGLHIIHKTLSQPQFIWATFEHVDNVPPASPAMFSNPTCQCQTPISQHCLEKTPASTAYQNCITGQAQGQTCTPNTSTPYYPPSASCPAYPVQVARNRPISNNSSDPVVATNIAAQKLLIAENPRTVFQYYELVDVLWSGSPQDNYTNHLKEPGPTVPLSMSGATPDPTALPVANTTMETYVQSKTCLQCHVYATVPGGIYASDFSFILGDAKSPSGASAFAAAPRPRRHLPAGLIKLQQ